MQGGVPMYDTADLSKLLSRQIRKWQTYKSVNTFAKPANVEKKIYIHLNYKVEHKKIVT